MKENNFCFVLFQQLKQKIISYLSVEECKKSMNYRNDKWTENK